MTQNLIWTYENGLFHPHVDVRRGFFLDMDSMIAPPALIILVNTRNLKNPPGVRTMWTTNFARRPQGNYQSESEVRGPFFEKCTDSENLLVPTRELVVQ